MKKSVIKVFFGLLLSAAVTIVVFFISDTIYSKLFYQDLSATHIKWDCGKFISSYKQRYKADCRGRWVKKSPSETYDTEFSTDSNGRRLVPQKAVSSSTESGLALFFGGSDLLGQGLDGEFALPNQFLNISDFADARNYGAVGVGPQHLLEFLIDGGIVNEAPPRTDRNVLLFLFSDVHVERVYGAWHIATGWGVKFPYYRLNKENKFEYRGEFASGDRYPPFLMLAKRSLLLDNLFSKISRRFSFTEGNIRLTALMFAEMKNIFERTYKNSRFVVIINPVTDRSRDTLLRYLRDYGVEYFDYSKLWDPLDPINRNPNGDHPSARVYKLYAEKLATDLRKQ